jgi:hypothetical protein
VQLTRTRIAEGLQPQLVSGERRFGLAPWCEVVELAKRAGFDTTTNPLKLAYLVTPPPIADWVANRPLIDFEALERLSADEILDDEMIAAARDFETKVISDSSEARGTE